MRLRRAWFVGTTVSVLALASMSVSPVLADETSAGSCIDADCPLRARFADDPEALARVLTLHTKTSDDVDVITPFVMDGGYRGLLKLVPAWPKGASRNHLLWVANAREKHVAFVEAIRARAKSAAPDGDASVKFRANSMKVLFFRSEKARTPSAYATGWTLAYNLDGSLNTSESAVDETFFHELFHANDTDHREFSLRVLAPIHGRIRAKCKADTTCLAPFAPNSTKVKGGTFYAFQPGNDAREYGAELAVRYYREMRLVLEGKSVAHPWKCGGPLENREAWDAFVREFFGGVDGIPCP